MRSIAVVLGVTACSGAAPPRAVAVAPPAIEGMVVADLDMALITQRKRMMDSVGHYARPEFLRLLLDDRPAPPMQTIPSGSTQDERTDIDRTTDQRVAVPRHKAD